ncbi:hypothetical protein J3362_03050 [Marinobacter sp. NFXS11]|uniref:hypothetical protein n=1 Tax=Marinobacter sp. NFXS11 TaxID=2818432 RepID=UPI0032DFBBEB
MSHQNKLAAVCVAVTLTACGGGGGKDSSSETAKPAAPIPTSVITVSESTTETRDLPDAFASLNGEVSSEGDLLSGSLVNGNLSVTVGEVDRPTETTAKVVNGDGKAIATLKVLVENTSAAPVIQTLEVLESQRANLLALSDLKALHKLIVDSAYLGSEISAAEQDSLLAQFNTDQLNRFPQAEMAFDEALTVLREYNDGTLGDDQLNPAQVIAELNFLAQEGHALVVSTAQNLSSPLAIPQNYDLQVNIDSSVVSRFIGQQDLGSMSGGQWSYDPTYQHLSLIQ